MQLLHASHDVASRPPNPGRGHRFLRHVDKYGGVPLVFMLGILRRRRTLPDVIKRVAVLNTAAIGDTVLMSGPLADLRSAYPEAELLVLVGPTNHDAAKLLGIPSRVIQLPIYSPSRAIRALRDLKLDLLIDLGPWPRLNAVLTALSRARFTVGFRTPGQYRHYAYDLAVRHSPNRHELDNYRHLVASLGISPSHPPRLVRERLAARPAALSPPYLVFHLWPGGTASILKQWPQDRWVRLAQHFAQKGFTIILTGSPLQRASNQQVVDWMDPISRRAIANHAGLGLSDTSAILTGAALVVSVDTGVMHLAAALDVPVVALMGPACRRRWGPIGTLARVVESPVKGCCYLHLGFEIPRHPPKCMEAISFEVVRDTCEQILLDCARCIPPHAPDRGGASTNAS